MGEREGGSGDAGDQWGSGAKLIGGNISLQVKTANFLKVILLFHIFE